MRQPSQAQEVQWKEDGMSRRGRKWLRGRGNAVGTGLAGC